MQTDSEKDILFINGVEVNSPHLSINNRAFLYGDGIFETIRIENGGAPLLQGHLQRLSDSATKLYLNLDLAEFKRQLDIIWQRLSSLSSASGSLKIILSRPESHHGCYPSLNQPVDIFLHFKTLENLHGWQQLPVQLKLASGCLSKNKVLAGLKHVSRLDYIVAAAGTRIDANEELLFLDEDQNVVETMHHNIFWLKNGSLHTADVSQVGVKGVMRDFLIRFCDEQLHSPVKVGAYSLADLKSADEIFLTNALRGIVPVVSLESVHYIDHAFASMVAECLPSGSLA